LLVAALAALAAIPSSALADPPADGGPGGDPCPAPEITHNYDTTSFTVHATLAASGCPAREHRQFMVSASIYRLDHDGGRNGVERTALCGPFRSSTDGASDEPTPSYSCDVDLALDHPEFEHAQYDVDVSYPGANSERNASLFTVCVSDGTTASCDE
jgi:hypothetical protein